MMRLAINSYILLNMCSWFIRKEFDLSVQKSELWQVLTVLTEILLKFHSAGVRLQLDAEFWGALIIID